MAVHHTLNYVLAEFESALSDPLWRHQRGFPPDRLRWQGPGRAGHYSAVTIDRQMTAEDRAFLQRRWNETPVRTNFVRELRRWFERRYGVYAERIRGREPIFYDGMWAAIRAGYMLEEPPIRPPARERIRQRDL